MNIFCGYGWVFPNQAVFWHPQTGLWYETGGKKGEAPTGPVKKLIEIFEKMKNEKELEKRHRLAHQAIRIHIDEGPFVFGTAGRGPLNVYAGPAGFYHLRGGGSDLADGILPGPAPMPGDPGRDEIL